MIQNEEDEVMEMFGEKLEALEDTGFTFSDVQEFFFVNVGKVITYTIASDQKKHPKFCDKSKRNMCLEQFLAYHSIEIGKNAQVAKGDGATTDTEDADRKSVV